MVKSQLSDKFTYIDAYTLPMAESPAIAKSSAIANGREPSCHTQKNDGNSNISQCKNNIIFFKTSQNPSKYSNSITNLKFQHKPKYHLSKTLI